MKEMREINYHFLMIHQYKNIYVYKILIFIIFMTWILFTQFIIVRDTRFGLKKYFFNPLVFKVFLLRGVDNNICKNLWKF